MLRLRINFSGVVSRIILLIALTFLCFTVSCGFIDLRPIGVKIEPGSNNSVLPEIFSPVIIRFDTAMIKNETEGNLHISSDSGIVRGDTYWNGNNFYFVPIPGWTAGTRYTLSLLGTLRSVDGRETRVEHFVSFFAINKNDPPLLEFHNPSDGVSVSTNNFVMEFHFSKSMDRHSVESALTLEGIRETTFEWLVDDKILKVSAGNVLSPWLFYRWSLRDSAKCNDGIPLPKTYSGNFITDLDQTLPEVIDVYPVLYADGSWFPTGACFETKLGQGQGAAVVFNKPMGENALRSLRFDPSLTGRTELLSENSIVYIFTRDPEPGTTYTLIVSGDTRDHEGLKIGADFRINFTPDIPLINITSINFGGGFVIENFSATNNFLQVQVNSATGEFYFTINFSLLFNNDGKQNTPQKIKLAPFFPRTLAPVALQDVNWLSSNRLYMRWEGLIATDDIPHYYTLTIPGGRGGINPDTGIFMKEDIVIYLEAIK
ncbi:MAG: hypothetical protein LBC80_04320 [Treponema sp.]|jgi:hypothetical protein|nr:hypothetical protein [Treponema sp.]